MSCLISLTSSSSYSYASGVMAVAEALHFLAKVASEALLPRFLHDHRIAKNAKNVSGVFKEYEEHLRAHDVQPDGAGLTNAERDLVGFIAKRAETALSVLQNVDCNAATALDRAYANGARIEEYLLELSRTRDAWLNSTKSRADEVEFYRPGSNVPPFPDNAHLEFDVRDENGEFSSPEGKFRAVVLSSSTSSHVFVARGAAKPSSVHGASGMAGVGKTTALVALGNDQAVRDHFRDGVLYLALDADASVAHVVRGLAEIMKITGAKASSIAVQDMTKLTDAVEEAANWFRGRRNLFVIDDVWPTKGCKQGYLPALCNILEGSPDSRIALTTRCRNIAPRSYCFVDFDARDPYGSISTSMFLLLATSTCKTCKGEQEHNLEAVQRILGLCDGLPIALAATGCLVASLVSKGFAFKDACEKCLKDLEEEKNLSGSILDTILNSAIQLSLKHIDAEHGNNPHLCQKYSMSEMYSSLCVLNKKQWVPVSVLARMWDVAGKADECIADCFASMSLGKGSIQENEESGKEMGLTIHDLQLDFCRQKVKGKSVGWVCVEDWFGVGWCAMRDGRCRMARWDDGDVGW